VKTLRKPGSGRTGGGSSLKGEGLGKKGGKDDDTKQPRRKRKSLARGERRSRER